MLHFGWRTTQGRETLASFTAIALLVAAAACGSKNSNNSTGVKTGSTGSLAVTITTPAGDTANVLVTGPGGYSRTLTNTTTLTELTAGSYTVIAATTISRNSIVGTLSAATVTGSPATVTASGAAATVTATYATRVGSGGLWVVNAGNLATVASFSAAHLVSSSSAAATTIIGSGTSALQAVAFDGNGNMWISSPQNNTVTGYASAKLGASAAPTPIAIISGVGTSLQGPSFLAFDASGNLWVSNNSGASVVEFAAAQLVTGAPTPVVVLSAVAGSLQNPQGLAFDRSGDLWVANNSANTLVEFTPSQIAASGAPVPTVVVSDTLNSLDAPYSLAFDASGNLWTTNFSANTVTGFEPNQLAASGQPLPMTTLSASAGSIQGPTGLAFDASGDLWVSNFTSNTVVEISASIVDDTGSPVPAAIINGPSLGSPFGIAFDVHDAGLPIKP